MSKYRSVRVQRELVEMTERVVESGRYHSLSEFVTEAIQLRLDALKQTNAEILEKPSEHPLIRERLLYSPDHLWVMVTPEGNAKIGLSDYAQTRLEGIVDIQTNRVGSDVKKAEAFGIIKTWLFVFDLHAPVSGKIIKFNSAIQRNPIIVNEDPSELGWIVEIKPHNLITLGEELRALMRPRKYETWVIKQSRPSITGQLLDCMWNWFAGTVKKGDSVK